ncbi:MAG: enoyl-CoA hydratase [Betaproteobacteria bacterium]|nr:enoyl-CoA hydratase [Betaproteobacteria bacterium]
MTSEKQQVAVLLRSTQDGVVRLTMNRPDRRNALNLEMTVALRAALTDAARDASVRAVVLTGAGSAFCAGGDVKNMAANPMAVESAEERIRTLRFRTEASRLLHEMPKPTIALLGGAAAGAGMALALACDFRLAVQSAKLTTAFAKVGLAGDFGMSYLLPRIVGGARARELLMLSPVLSAEEALNLGLIHRVFSADEFAARSEEFIARLAQGPTLAYGRIKANLNEVFDVDFDASLDNESSRQVACFPTEDHREASQAFVAKREPKFVGR